MRLTPCLLLSCLPFLTACQLLGSSAEPAGAKPVRLQGELWLQDGQLQLQPCNEQRSLLLREGDSGLLREVARLGEGASRLFVDLDGQRVSGDQPTLSVAHLYRLEREGHGCAEPDLRRLVLTASGNEPAWNLRLNRHGLVLLRPGQEPLALPYLEEQLPGGSYSFTSEANGQRLDLWVAPKRCVDDMSGSLRHLSAELRLDGEVLRGCAALGGARDR